MLNHHAQLIVGHYEKIFPVLKEELEVAGILTDGNPDFWYGFFEMFGVDDARHFISQQLRKSVGGGDKIFIIGWQQTTVEAQNALLKVFEEPTPHTFIFLITHREELIIPTLRSRILKYSPEISEEHDEDTVRTFLRMGATQRLGFVDTMIQSKDRGAVLRFVESLERVFHSQTSDTKQIETLSHIVSARRNLATRSPSLKLILEHLALVVPRVK